MIYKIELPKKITDYMIRTSGSIENYLQLRVIDSIIRELEKEEFNLVYAIKLEKVRADLKKLKKEVSIIEYKKHEVTTGEKEIIEKPKEEVIIKELPVPIIESEII